MYILPLIVGTVNPTLIHISYFLLLDKRDIVQILAAKMRECCIQLFAQSMENFQFTYSLNWKFWKIHLQIYQIGNIRRFSFMFIKMKILLICILLKLKYIQNSICPLLLPLPRIASNFPLTSFNVYKSLPITTFSWRNYSPSESKIYIIY